ncbi:MAG: hypothetical protein IJ583_11810 [Firmicutes bacterium]|nr:hypothetical protein [Bacillota bacterium]
MSTRKIAYSIIDSMNDEQIKSFIVFFNNMFPDKPNAETLNAIHESEMMMNDPYSKKFNSVNELFGELES